MISLKLGQNNRCSSVFMSPTLLRTMSIMWRPTRVRHERETYLCPQSRIPHPPLLVLALLRSSHRIVVCSSPFVLSHQDTRARPQEFLFCHHGQSPFLRLLRKQLRQGSQGLHSLNSPLRELLPQRRRLYPPRRTTAQMRAITWHGRQGRAGPPTRLLVRVTHRHPCAGQ